MPKPRGPLSEWVVARLATPVEGSHAPTAGEWDDECIALWTLHEMHYRGFEDAADDAEWQPALLAVRHDLEVALEQRLRRRWQGYAFQSPSSLSEAWSSGRRPSGQWNSLSLSAIARSLIEAWRRVIRPFSSNSQFSLP